jgi:hypothetical protein
MRDGQIPDQVIQRRTEVMDDLTHGQAPLRQRGLSQQLEKDHACSPSSLRRVVERARVEIGAHLAH